MRIKWKARFPGRLLVRMKRMRPGPVRWTPRMRRWLAVAGACAFSALLTAAGLPLLHGIYAAGWIAAEHYHVAFAALCIVPAAAAHGAARHSGARGSALWLAWLPGIAAYAAFPWPKDGTWQPLWIFGHAWDWAVTIFLHWDTASTFAFNSFGAFVAMVTVAFAAFGRLWLGLARALGRAGSEALAPDDAEGALPNATWASRSEIVKDFSVPGGIVLGELTDPVKGSPDFAPGRPRSWGRQGSGQLITMSPEEGNGHVLVTSQASGYKSTGLVIPNILTYDGPLVVFDPKCELYARCWKARDDMGFRPVVIDAKNGFDPARLIAALADDHPSAYRRMAKMVIPQGHSGIENAAYFKAAATHLLTALLAYYAENDSPNILQDVARVLARSAEGVHGAVGRKSKKSPLAFVRNQLGALKGMDEKFFASVKTEITNQLTFAEMPDVERYITMGEKSRLPSQIIDPKCDIFLNIPQNVAEDFAPMVRLMLGSMLTAAQLIEVNEDPSARRLFLIDEAAKLGAMDILENIRDRGRSLGLHLMMFYQTPGEIERIWGRAGMTSWRDGCSATVMGPVSSRASAQDLSAMLGMQTLRVRTESTSSSSQVHAPMAGSVSTSEQEQLRDVPLISPTAISQLPTHGSIITATGRKPVLATKAIFFTRDDMKDRVRSTEDITDELAVTATRDALTDRLAKMSDDEGEGSPGPAETGGPGDGPPEAGSGTVDSRAGSDIEPAVIEIEGDVEPPWTTAGTDEGPERPTGSGRGTVSEANGADSEQAMARAPRHDRREDRPGKTAEPDEAPDLPPANCMATDAGSPGGVSGGEGRTPPPAPQEPHAARKRSDSLAPQESPEAGGIDQDGAGIDGDHGNASAGKVEWPPTACVDDNADRSGRQGNGSPAPGEGGGETDRQPPEGRTSQEPVAAGNADATEDGAHPQAAPPEPDAKALAPATAPGIAPDVGSTEPEAGEGSTSSREDASRVQDASADSGPVGESAADAGDEGAGSAEPDTPETDPPAPVVATDPKTEVTDPGQRAAATDGDSDPDAVEIEPGIDPDRAVSPPDPESEPAPAPAETDKGPKPAPEDGPDDNEWTKEERERAMALARDENISFEEIAGLLGKSLAAVKACSDRERARGLLPKSARESGRGSENGRTGENA